MRQKVSQDKKHEEDKKVPESHELSTTQRTLREECTLEILHEISV